MFTDVCNTCVALFAMFIALFAMPTYKFAMFTYTSNMFTVLFTTAILSHGLLSKWSGL